MTIIDKAAEVINRALAPLLGMTPGVAYEASDLIVAQALADAALDAALPLIAKVVEVAYGTPVNGSIEDAARLIRTFGKETGDE